MARRRPASWPGELPSRVRNTSRSSAPPSGPNGDSARSAAPICSIASSRTGSSTWRRGSSPTQRSDLRSPGLHRRKTRLLRLRQRDRGHDRRRGICQVHFVVVENLRSEARRRVGLGPPSGSFKDLLALSLGVWWVAVFRPRQRAGEKSGLVPIRKLRWGQRRSRCRNEGFSCKVKEDEALRGGVLLYAAQGNPKSDAEIAENAVSGRERARRPYRIESTTTF